MLPRHLLLATFSLTLVTSLSAENSDMPNLLANPTLHRAQDGQHPQWTIEGSTLIQPGTEEEPPLLRREGRHAPTLRQRLDLSQWQGRKLAFTFEARITGAIIPWFEVVSLDGELGSEATGRAMRPTAQLAEFNRFGWYYDFRYGWPVNNHLPHLYRDHWQTIGAVFTVPDQLRNAELHLQLRPAKYSIMTPRDPNPSRNGTVELRNLRISPITEREPLPTTAWEKENPDQQSFFFLSYFYNQQQIRLSDLQMRLWRAHRLAGEEAAPLEKSLLQHRSALDALSRYFHHRFPTEIATLDLTEQQNRYPAPEATGALANLVSLRPYYLSLYLQDLVDNGFSLKSPTAKALEREIDKLEADLGKLEVTLRQQHGAQPAPELAKLSYADLPAILPANGKAPAILYATGNTTNPLRIYKDLGIDLFSKNYPVTTFDDQGLVEDSSLPLVLERYHLKQISTLFTPVHGLFAVSEKLLAKYKGKWRTLLREERPNVIAVHARDPKLGTRDVLKLNMDEFEPQEGKTYILPLNPLSPDGERLLSERLAFVSEHTRQPANRKVIAAVELSAEPTSIVGTPTDPFTRAAYLRFLEEHSGGIAAINTLYGSDLSSTDALIDAPDPELPPALKSARHRWQLAFRVLTDAEVYRKLQSGPGLEGVTFLHRNNDLYFSDFAWVRASLKDSYVNYHAGWDRVYGYDLGRFLGKDHLTGEDHPGLPSGIKERHTVEMASANFLKGNWGYAAWGTKSIQIWRPYREEAWHSVATHGSDYTVLNENWTYLPWMKSFIRGFGRVLDGSVLPRRVAYLQLEQQEHVTWYMPSIYTTNQFLRREQIGYGYTFEQALAQGKDKLENYDLLLLPPSQFITRAMQEKLLKWVESGGELILFGPAGLYDEKSLPSGWLMEQCFGAATWRLIGTAQQLRRPVLEGLWSVAWGQGKPDHVRATPLPAEIPLPQEEGEPLFEKKWNSFDHVTRLPKDDTLDPDTLVEQLLVAPRGKGKVILIPREFLPAHYRDALAAELGNLLSRSACHLDQPGFNTVRRTAKGDTSGTEYLFIQNEEEWLGPRSANVSVQGEYAVVEEVSDLRHAFPVEAQRVGGRTVFPLTLHPGEIATFRLRPAAAP